MDVKVMSTSREIVNKKQIEHFEKLLQDPDKNDEREFINAMENWHVVHIPAEREDCLPRLIIEWLENEISGRYLWNTLNEVTLMPRSDNDLWRDKK
jgi:hypothetical protein